MKQRTFEKSHQPQWELLESWLDRLEKRDSLKIPNIAEFPQCYRQVCQHLALARDRHYTPYLIERLNRLVLRGHQYFYTTPSRLMSKVLDFFSVNFPQQVREESHFVILSSLLFFGSLLIMFVGVQINPDLIYSIMDAKQIKDIENMYNPLAEHLGLNRESQTDFLMFGFYIRNNITIDFQTFAGGIFFGLGSLFFIIFNGLYLGSVAGHLTHVGYGVPFYSFIAGHSSFELMAIVLSGAAGLKLGFALIAPRRLSRSQALRQAANHSIVIIYGVIALSVLAAFLEAFWSSNSAIEPVIKYTVGCSLWLLVIAYFMRMGRNRAT
jgi:uncharacterized membrane protein SpoIIM required for sporulation